MMPENGLVFERLGEKVLEVRDTISDQQYRIESSEPMELEPSEYDGFPGPVTDTVSVDAVDFEFPVFYSATVRDESGDKTTHLGVSGDSYTADGGTTFVELHTPVKSYLRLEGQFECATTDRSLTFEFAKSTSILLGARPLQCSPNVTITVSDTPEDLREAISHFGDKLLTPSPERSFATLRGHPPRLRVGESLDIPDTLSKPDTGVTITTPRDESALLTVAPLAYYLLATVEFGDEFSLRTEDGYTYTPPESNLTAAVKSLLTRFFYLDCIVRTEGLYPLDVQERRDFESQSSVDFDFPTLYDQPLPRRIKRYLQVDPDVVTAITSDWPTTAVVEPGKRAIEALPYLVFELAHIVPSDPPRYSGKEARKRVLKMLTQRKNDTRSTSLVFNNTAEFVDVPSTESQQTIWVGDGIPLNASKFVLEGYQNDTVVDSDESETGKNGSSTGLEITVVCNSPKMAEEPENIRKGWDSRDDFPMELTTYSQVSRDQLRRILESGTDYLHFVGHATPDGLRCVDGLLDVTTIDESNVDTFFLNACQSYEQGKRLVERGSSGGIVTYTDISNTFALRIGNLVARLLNMGFPIGPTLDIVQETTPVGKNYTTVGTHAAKIIQPEWSPCLTEITPQSEGFNVKVTTVAAGLPESTIGGLSSHTSAPEGRYYIMPSSVDVRVTLKELEEFLEFEEMPVVYEGELMTQAEFFERVDAQR